MGLISRLKLYKDQYPLSFRLLFYVVLCSSFFTLLATAFQLYFDYKRDLKVIRSNLQLIEISYVPSISTSLYYMDDVQLRIQLKGAIKLQDIEYLHIKEDRGDVEFAMFEGDPNATRDIVRKFPLQFHKPSSEIISLGFLTAAASLEGVYNRLWDKILIILGSNAVKMFLASAFILFIIQSLITRHLTKMASFTRQLNLNKLDIDLALDRKPLKSSVPDELDQVTMAINDMQTRLRGDIEQRTQMEEKLRESEAQYHGIFNAASDAVFVFDMNGNIVDANPETSRMYGYSHEELMELHPQNIIHPDDYHIFEKFLKEIKETGELNTEARNIRKDGTLFNIEVKMVLFYYGRKKHLLSIVRDITERVHAEEALRRSEERYRTLVEMSPDAIYVHQKGKFVYINREGEKTFGVTSSEELIGKPVFDFIHPDYHEIVRERLELIHKEKKRLNTIEEKFIRVDGEVIDVEATGTLVTYNDKPATLGIVRNITARKQMEKAVLESEEKYRALFEDSRDAIFINTREGKFIDVNQAMLDIFGYTKEEMMSINSRDLYADPDSRPGFLKQMDQKGFLKNFEDKYKKKNGTEMDCLLTATVRRAEDGSILGYKGIIRDITNQKKTEEQLKISLKEKEVLLREIHHRVKNNMQVIIALLRFQSEKIEEKKYADMFTESQERIKSMALIHEKLYQTKDFANIDFNGYAKSLLNGLFIAHGVDTTKIKAKIEIENLFLDLENAIPCGLILNEVVSNSLKYAFPENREGEIRISFRLDNEDKMELIIGDNGVGMSEEVDIRNTESLGLYIIERLVKYQLGGEIELNRTNGTEYHIKFKRLLYKKRI